MMNEQSKVSPFCTASVINSVKKRKKRLFIFIFIIYIKFMKITFDKCGEVSYTIKNKPLNKRSR